MARIKDIQEYLEDNGVDERFDVKKEGKWVYTGGNTINLPTFDDVPDYGHNNINSTEREAKQRKEILAEALRRF